MEKASSLEMICMKKEVFKYLFVLDLYRFKIMHSTICIPYLMVISFGKCAA